MHWKKPLSRIAVTAGKTPVYLLREVEKYLSAANVPPTRFGRDAMGDPRFVFDLRRGREPGARTVRRVRAYLELAR